MDFEYRRYITRNKLHDNEIQTALETYPLHQRITIEPFNIKELVRIQCNKKRDFPISLEKEQNNTYI